MPRADLALEVRDVKPPLAVGWLSSPTFPPEVRMHGSILSQFGQTSHRMALVVLVGATLSACADAPAPLAPEGPAFSKGNSENTPAHVQQQLAALRGATAQFHDFDATTGEGGAYHEQLSPCVEVPGLGGMGYHYGNMALVDGTVSLLEPEVAMYEPQKNGKMRLVAVEYIVPLALSEDAPVLMGQTFHRNERLGLWALHVWIWKHNPMGVFEDFNPTVSCQFAP